MRILNERGDLVEYGAIEDAGNIRTEHTKIIKTAEELAEAGRAVVPKSKLLLALRAALHWYEYAKSTGQGDEADQKIADIIRAMLQARGE